MVDSEFEYYQPGETILREGHPADCVYWILEGEVSITKRGRFLATKGQYQYLGELGYFCHWRRRIATAKAETTVTLKRMSYDEFEQWIQQFPVQAFWLTQDMARGLIETTGKWSHKQAELEEFIVGHHVPQRRDSRR